MFVYSTNYQSETGCILVNKSDDGSPNTYIISGDISVGAKKQLGTININFPSEANTSNYRGILYVYI